MAATFYAGAALVVGGMWMWARARDKVRAAPVVPAHPIPIDEDYEYRGRTYDDRRAMGSWLGYKASASHDGGPVAPTYVEHERRADGSIETRAR